ncbi:hypothetical protein CIHG_00301 [Coccidioides immitis H538.4]|uniref:Uncharacterized protein n=3 Tax=Coccidioides immitis TaxID=5501 RepID=A0A0J8QI38_COCIT|nr:hypothetical protein CIRG_07120 [Coccidioides immitis RMSCC 2394]KMU72106.1 hypothetical protein CISG_00415 [Coccidioides immitis RMSCC 3703]KMU82520.1 hypothetical protein CIHG_00301 [Coccidioides immitis H538.4]
MNNRCNIPLKVAGIKSKQNSPPREVSAPRDGFNTGAIDWTHSARSGMHGATLTRGRGAGRGSSIEADAELLIELRSSGLDNFVWLNVVVVWIYNGSLVCLLDQTGGLEKSFSLNCLREPLRGEPGWKFVFVCDDDYRGDATTSAKLVKQSRIPAGTSMNLPGIG